MSLNKPIESITEDDLQALIDNQKAERKTLEYKQTLPGGTDDNKKEFLADVSSFANASGGIFSLALRSKQEYPRSLLGYKLMM